MAGYLLAGVAIRLFWGPQVNQIVAAAVVAGAAPLLLIFMFPQTSDERSRRTQERGELADRLLQSSNPIVLATDMEGRFTYLNPAAERSLGLRALELIGKAQMTEIFAPGELERISHWLRKLHPGAKADEPVVDAMRDCVEYVLEFPPSQLRSIELELRRHDGSTFPATLYLSAIRDAEGKPAGIVAVALDRTLSNRQERALRESSERYRDLFENTNEMIATLGPSGQFVDANPVWKSCFGLTDEDFSRVESLELLFSPESRLEVGRLFRMALDGQNVERAAVRTHTLDGRVVDLEVNLGRRQKSDGALAVRCMMRDMTPQKQRERRLALQLVVSQIIGQSASPEVAAVRILESLCLSQDWDTAVLWSINEAEDKLQFAAAWGAPGRRSEGLIQESMGQTIGRGPDLPGRVWAHGKAVWIDTLTAAPASARTQAALRHGLVSGWAVPVRIGNRLIAILEFYTHQKMREDRESMATLETVTASLGQMLARSREQDRVEELHRTQEILLDTIEDGICATDRSGLTSLVNPAAGRLLGAMASELAGMGLHDLLHGKMAGGCTGDCALQRAIARNVSASAEITVYRQDGSSFPAEFSLTPILDQGRSSGLVLSFRDISQRFALDRMKDEFVSTVSHELRTPLTSIRGALGLLSAGLLSNVSDKAANLLRIALSNSDRLVRLINDILDLERIQSGREPLSFRSVLINEVVRQAIDGMQPVADAAGIHLIHDGNDVQVAADPDRLLQVVTNLLSNAVKFSPQDSTVAVTLREDPHGITLSVIDQGRGIPADKLDTIFDRFQQVDASDSRQKGGSGLGLAICRTIIRQHGGHIWAERNPVRGSTFRVTLPYQPAPGVAPVQTQPPLELDRGRILVADTNVITRTMVANQLRRQNYQVVEAGSVEETLAAVGAGFAADETARANATGTPGPGLAGIEAILVDISLDGLNGWEILPRLRLEPAAAGVPIVLLSVDHPNPTIPLPTGADGWVAQSPDDETLLNELARVLSAPGENARILVVEDDIDLARVIGAVFAKDGIDIKLAHTRQAALEACMSFRPQLIVLDLSLPDGDGFNVVDWLRSHDDLAHLPLVVYSAREIAPAERSQLQLGPTHFLTKARVQPQQLEALVLTMLRRSRQMEESICLVPQPEEEQQDGSAAPQSL
ncbi:MAG TPA: PAS domain S-box protein [Acidobacteriaceae bacterium]|nr:PAS domain S-box protein [Acidobacteriaceae bacterium]